MLYFNHINKTKWTLVHECKRLIVTSVWFEYQPLESARLLNEAKADSTWGVFPSLGWGSLELGSSCARASLDWGPGLTGLFLEPLLRVMQWLYKLKSISI